MTIPNREKNSIWRFSDMPTKWEHGSWCLVRNCCLLGCSPSPRPYTHSQVGTGHWKNKFSNSVFISIVWLNVWNHKRDVCYVNVSRTKEIYSWGFRFPTVSCLCVLFYALGKTWSEDSTLHSPSHSGSLWGTLSMGTVVEGEERPNRLLWSAITRTSLVFTAWLCRCWVTGGEEATGEWLSLT